MVKKLLPLVAVCGIVLLTLYFTRSHTDSADSLTPVASIGLSGESDMWQPGQVNQRPTILQSNSSSSVGASPVDTALPPSHSSSSPLTADGVPQAQLRLPSQLGSGWAQLGKNPSHLMRDVEGADEARHEVNRPWEAEDETSSESSGASSTGAPAMAARQSTFPISAPVKTSEPPIAQPSTLSTSTEPSATTANTSATGAPTPTLPDPAANQAPASPEATAPSASTPFHVVRPGESLVDIARQHLGQGVRWIEIYRLNREQLGSQVNVLPPGMRLRLPER